ncbi:hypothetical protein [Clostridium manihotivorum]|uniref:Membrane-associated protein n=1 Tax=Clostridium manihotivorum TaxID=2320868 RepID=A0A3R5TD92_9CLOT|nr:hypothetical protein [Clostridium manihotivorum]QAA30689.1 hypothetical protein C1I91_02840 [Clostridium manihotivorum]
MKEIINRKQLGVMLILIALMAVLFIAQTGFNDRFRIVSLMNSNITDFKQYSVVNGKYTFKLPSEWESEQKSYPGNYIVYDNNFKNDDLGILGYAQVINSNEKLDKVVSDDKNRLSTEKILDYKVVSDKINGNECKKVNYKEKLNKGKLVYHSTYYVSESDGVLFKVDFSIGQDQYKESLTSVFDTVIESFKSNK